MATPTITPVAGYDPEQDGTGTIAPNHVWAQVSGWLGGHWYSIPDPDALKVTAKDGGTRQVDITGGYAGAVGVVNEVGDGSTAVAGDVTIAASDPAATTWYMLCLHYAFGTTQKTSFKVITAGANAVVPVRDYLKFGPSPSVGAEDQPLALVQLTPGQSTPTKIIDLRLIGSNAVYLANSDLVLSYAGWPGTVVRIGKTTYTRTATGWYKDPGPYGRVELERIFPFGTGHDGWSCVNDAGTDGTTAVPFGNMVQIDVQMRNITDDVTFGGQGGIADHKIAGFGQSQYMPDRPVRAINASIVADNGFTYDNVGLRLEPDGDFVLTSGPPNITIRRDSNAYSLFATILYTIARA